MEVFKTIFWAGYVLEKDGLRGLWIKKDVLKNLGQFKTELPPQNNMQI